MLDIWICSSAKQLLELSQQTNWPTSLAVWRRTSCPKSSASWGGSIESLNSASCLIKTSSCTGHLSWRFSGEWGSDYDDDDNMLAVLSSSVMRIGRMGYFPAYGGNGNSRNVSCSIPSLHCRKRPWEGALYKWLTRSASDAMHVVLYKWTTFTFYSFSLKYYELHAEKSALSQPFEMPISVLNIIEQVKKWVLKMAFDKFMQFP